MNDTYKFIYFGHYNFENKETKVRYTGWCFWFLPNLCVGLRDDEFGIRPEKYSISEDEFAALGGVEAFSELLGKDVIVSFRVYGKKVRLAGIQAVKK